MTICITFTNTLKFFNDTSDHIRTHINKYKFPACISTLNKDGIST